MTRTVFYGFGAFVGRISGLTTCSWWPDEPASLGWSEDKLIPVDLCKSPAAVYANQIKVDEIEVDDHRVNGLTGIGPRWPGGQTIGACWLSETYWKSLVQNQPPRQPPTAAGDACDYELTSILYWDGDLIGRRFYGFHAKIVDSRGPLTRVQIWRAGTSQVKGQPPAGEWWLDLAIDAHPLDRSDAEATQISPGGLTEGALFLNETTTRSMMLTAAKRPPAGGGDLFQLRKEGTEGT